MENSQPIELIDGKKIARVITTARGFGGSERSTINIMRMFLEKGYATILTPTGQVSNEYAKHIPEGVQVARWDTIPGFKTDITVLYCSDTIWNYNNEQYMTMMPRLNTERKVMVVNFKVGSVGQVNWTKDWDKYLFLSSQHRDELLVRMPHIKTKVMAPPTELDIYFQNEPDYSLPLRLIRHNSQGDSKHHPDTNKRIQEILDIDSTIQFYFMPARSDCMDHPNIHKHAKNTPPVNEFLKLGNCMMYALPANYSEGGPKVVMEAMASGIACIVDNHSGMKDRVTNETGWLCNDWKDYLEAIKEILSTPEILKIKGYAARERTKQEFIQERWIEEILGD